jgi:ribose transport system ATP-binding protein
VTDSPAVAVAGLTKRFGPNTVLSSVDLSVSYGSVHGLLGENGSGKSTLIKILAGFHEADAGAVYLDGEDVGMPVSAAARARHRMSFVHQQLSLVPSLTVAENLFIDELAVPGRVPARFGMRRAVVLAAAVLAEMDVPLDPRRDVSELPALDRARLAIVRAALGVGMIGSVDGIGGGRRGEPGRGGILVLDEPTAALDRDEVRTLFSLIRAFSDRGGAVLFVSHDLDEVLDLTDQVTVLRDGHRVRHAPTAALTKDELVTSIVGQAVSRTRTQPARSRDGKKPVLSVRGLGSALVQRVDLELGDGEIVGITGILGSGADSVPYLLAGASPASSGILEQAGQPAVELRQLSPRTARKRGLAFVPANRALEAAVLSMSVAENIDLPFELRRGWFTARRMMASAGAAARRFDVRPFDPGMQMSHLSGGNQQKCVLARWYERDPAVVLLCHPTQGVDVGARQQIYAMLRETAPGRGTLVASNDHDELAQLCHRVLIMARGRIAAELAGPDLSAASITESCLLSEAAS